MQNNQERNYAAVSKKWQERFSFFDQHGEPNSPQFKAAIKALSFGKRILILVNLWAFFFSFIFFFTKGMWRKGLAWIGVLAVLVVVQAILYMVFPESAANGMSRGLGIAYQLLASMSANYAVYLHKVKQDQTWNPFYGIRW